MKIRYFASSLTILMLLLVITNRATATGGELNLPQIPVTIEVSDGTESTFITELSNVPMGYDVTNGTYLGWCVDVSAEMARSPATHTVILYSSSNPPGELINEKWDLLNYILNHKQGTAEDIQQAIWYFIQMDGSYTPTRSMAWTIINDTVTHGNGFIPQFGQIMAVICYPIILFPGQEDVQVSVIEITNMDSPFDVNDDGYVGVDDIVLVAEHFGFDPSHPDWNPIYDVNNDNYVGVDDVVLVAEHFGESY
ncbi:MAG: hypothetical protein JSV05_02940 [Candidatus Bathyarchaeota archaeon]|nr:MAG: hypothetical protein JSV05_02940 [Candidatus Bathyarchaeota archaeon]